MKKKHKKVGTNLTYTEHLPILVSAFTGCFSFSALASLTGIPITSSARGIKICAMATGIKKYKSIIRKRRRNMTR